jgi:hypothetical protein
MNIEERNIANGGRLSQEGENIRESGRRMRCMRRIPSRNPSQAAVMRRPHYLFKLFMKK